MGNIFCPQNKYLSDAYYYDKSSWFVISENNIDSNTGRYPFCIYITGMNISCGALSIIRDHINNIINDTTIDTKDIWYVNIIRKFSNEIIRCMRAYIVYEDNQDITDQVNRYLFTYHDKSILEIKNVGADIIQQKLKNESDRFIGKLTKEESEHCGRLYPLEFSECDKC